MTPERLAEIRRQFNTYGDIGLGETFDLLHAVERLTSLGSSEQPSTGCPFPADPTTGAALPAGDTTSSTSVAPSGLPPRAGPVADTTPGPATGVDLPCPDCLGDGAVVPWETREESPCPTCHGTATVPAAPSHAALTTAEVQASAVQQWLEPQPDPTGDGASVTDLPLEVAGGDR